MIHVLFALVVALVTPAHAASVPDEPVVTLAHTQRVQPVPQLAQGWRFLTGTGLVLSGLGVGIWGLGVVALAEGSLLGAAVSAGAGALLIGVGSPLANLSAMAQARRIGARPLLAARGLICLVGAVGCYFLAAVVPSPIGTVALVAVPILGVTSVVFAAGQGVRNIRHGRGPLVRVLPRIGRGHLGIALAATW